MKTEPDLNLNELANKYEITGAAILNVMHYAMLKAMAANDSYIRYQDIIEGIRRELRKAEKTMV